MSEPRVKFNQSYFFHFSAGDLAKGISQHPIPSHRFPEVREMNETRELMFGLKMSETPGEENKGLGRLPHEGSEVGWGRRLSPHHDHHHRSLSFGKAAMALAGDLVMSSSPDPALFPSLPILSTHCTQGSHR